MSRLPPRIDALSAPGVFGTPGFARSRTGSAIETITPQLCMDEEHSQWWSVKGCPALRIGHLSGQVNWTQHSHSMPSNRSGRARLNSLGLRDAALYQCHRISITLYSG
ncbi:hypothetical protein PAXRUDRAFT_604996 [Paxillus rubicundulus Ve08.2h10]|uniref:Uncharacterized protein n=1 Tax=Paxillus rubicundulus Ve08.2h10 TaxID=930991 RepID=A0A0D0DKK7_9AGAM|nr:hypothetical protein PAXRUDRAFT_604996 [Paxillus rubicundulus Ve08.2h10]